jgi:hypothetical protein
MTQLIQSKHTGSYELHAEGEVFRLTPEQQKIVEEHTKVFYGIEKGYLIIADEARLLALYSEYMEEATTEEERQAIREELLSLLAK